MTNKSSTILIVEDDLDVADMLNAYFRVQGYEVLTVNWGEDGVRSAESNAPDLVILDIRLPDIDGYEVAKRLRNSRKTQNIPIIFLTEKRGREDRLKGLEIGGDDYITKPFDIQELRLRVRNALQRNNQNTITNPVTNLPDGDLMDERLTELLNTDGWSVLMVSLINLDIFREAYGFVASDDVLRAVSLMINNVLREIGSGSDFLGHLTPTQFGVITTPENTAKFQKHISTRLEQSLDYFYPLKDREGEIPEDQKLGIRLAEAQADHEQFDNIDTLKTYLLRQRN